MLTMNPIGPIRVGKRCIVMVSESSFLVHSSTSNTMSKRSSVGLGEDLKFCARTAYVQFELCLSFDRVSQPYLSVQNVISGTEIIKQCAQGEAMFCLARITSASWKARCLHGRVEPVSYVLTQYDSNARTPR